MLTESKEGETISDKHDNEIKKLPTNTRMHNFHERIVKKTEAHIHLYYYEEIVLIKQGKRYDHCNGSFVSRLFLDQQIVNV